MEFSYYLRSKGFRPSSIKSHERTLKFINENIQRRGVELESFSYDDLMMYVKRRRTRVTPRTINGEISILRHLFDYLILQGIRFDNPAKGVLIKGTGLNKLYQPLSSEYLTEIYKSFQAQTSIDVRNKVLFGLYVFQGLTTTEISNLNTFNLDLEECKLTIPESARNAGRTVQIKSLQLMTLIRYLEESRGLINSSEDPRLIVSSGNSKSILNVTSQLMREVKKRFSNIESWKHIRVSVISNELTESNLRQSQYKFGFRHIDSVEKYLQNNVEDLRGELDRCFGI